MEIIRESGSKQVGGSAANTGGREISMQIIRESGSGKQTSGGSSAVSMEIVRESGGSKQTSGGSSAVSASTAQVQVQLINQ
jgi:hypothetical protein